MKRTRSVFHSLGIFSIGFIGRLALQKRDLPLLHQKNVKQGEIVDEKQKYEKIILKISLYAGMAFVVVELFMSLWSSSQAILMDAVFDAAELIVIGLSLFC